MESSWSQSRINVIHKAQEIKNRFTSSVTFCVNTEQVDATGNNCMRCGRSIIVQSYTKSINSSSMHKEGERRHRPRRELYHNHNVAHGGKHPVHFFFAPHCESWSTNFRVLRWLPEIDFSLKMSANNIFLPRLFQKTKRHRHMWIEVCVFVCRVRNKSHEPLAGLERNSESNHFQYCLTFEANQIQASCHS